MRIDHKASAKTYILLGLLITSLAVNAILLYSLSSFTQRIEVGGLSPHYNASSSVYIVGVMGGRNVKGVVMLLEGMLVEGNGQVYVSTTPKIGIELQEAAEKAFKAAQRFTGIDVSNLDLMLRVVSNESVYVVDGPSAGAAVAVLASSMLLNVPIRKDVMITGTIDEYGRIGPVGGILYKAEAAAKMGAKIFLVPKGQSVDRVYVRVEKKIAPGVIIVYYKPELINVEEYLRSKGYDIHIIEVSTLSEVFNYFKA
ncbi:MAG: S16 family serine protease [Candidatus Nezhaarchaeales archaeon]